MQVEQTKRLQYLIDYLKKERPEYRKLDIPADPAEKKRLLRALMEKQGHEEPAGSAKITRAYNLPCKYVLHTVGPIIHGPLRDRDRDLLASCYRSCLALAETSGVKTIAFCCISTGEFHFPKEEAAKIAVDTVRAYRKETNTDMEVIFNVFKDQDREIYERLLGIAR